MARLMRGVITAFDAESGLGSVRTDSGQPYPFHCTQIADGSRQIDEAAKVEFEVVAGHGGQWEAATLRPCAG